MWSSDLEIIFPLKHVVCYSGGHSSALVALEVTNRYGYDDVILLNHDIAATSEHESIKQFKRAVAAYIGLPITYANAPDWDKKDQFDVVIEAGAFKVGNGSALCTNRMKTKPFEQWLRANFPTQNAIVYYGFDNREFDRIQRRSSRMAVLGFKTDYPLALWRERAFKSTKEIGIEPPSTYSIFKHANCVGCLKAQKQHWYVVYCVRPDIWEKAKMAEDEIGYTILRFISLKDIEPLFAVMKTNKVPATEHCPKGEFWKQVRLCEAILKTKTPIDDSDEEKPCECVI